MPLFPFFVRSISLNFWSNITSKIFCLIFLNQLNLFRVFA